MVLVGTEDAPVGRDGERRVPVSDEFDGGWVVSFPWQQRLQVGL